MSQSPEQIESDIDKTRAELHSNLQELENKVKSAADWRQLFAKHPGAMAAAAFGVGALLSTLMGRRTQSPAIVQDAPRSMAVSNGHGVPARQKHQALQSWDNIKNAMVGLAATKVTGYLGGLMPGFEGELQKVAPDNRPPPSREDSPQGPLM